MLILRFNNSMPYNPNAQKAILYMVIGVFLSISLDTSIKWLAGQGYAAIQILFFRSFFALIPIMVYVVRNGGLKSVVSLRPHMHILRGVVGFFSAILVFWAFGHMPLPKVTLITFTSPLFICLLSVFLLKERWNIPVLIAIAVGFAAVFYVVNPKLDVLDQPALAVLISVFLYALGNIIIKQMSYTEPPFRIVFWTMAGWSGLSFILMLPYFQMPRLEDIPVILYMGIIGGISHLFIANAFRYASPQTVAPFEYSAIIWSLLFSYIIWDELPTSRTITGGIFIILCGLYVIISEARKAK